MTTSIRPVTAVHRGRFNVRVRDGKTWTRVVEGTEPGEFEMGAYGVTIHGKMPGVWTLIPWPNILVIEPTT